MNDRFRFRAIDNRDWADEKGKIYYDVQDAYDYGGGEPEVPANSFGCIVDGEGWIVEQCTGLKDKNGRLIYEGDILDFDLSIPKNGGHYRGIVYWQNQNNLIGWMISSLKHTGSWDIRQIAHPNDWMTWAKVIGNIHENPELLEDK